MSECAEVTRIITAIENGEQRASEELLPLVYTELRRLAAGKLAHERPGQTLQATALVHEAYLRLNPSDPEQKWNGKRHFFGAAAQAMRRILVENARRKGRIKHGGELVRVELRDDDAPEMAEPDYVLAVDEALEKFKAVDPVKTEVVVLKFFGGLTTEETAEALGVAVATVNRHWAYARAWLGREMSRDDVR